MHSSLEVLTPAALVAARPHPKDPIIHGAACARAMQYLAEADFVTGHVLNVDGGYVI